MSRKSIYRKISTDSGVFTIRPFRDGDESRVTDLFRKAFGQQMDITEWRWKYPDNPLGFQAMMCLTEHGELAAYYAGIPYKAIYKGNEVQISQLVDSMSDPGYRGVIGGRKGLFVQTVQAFFDEFAHADASIFLYGFPGVRHYKLGHLLLKYNRIGREEFILEKRITPQQSYPGFSLLRTERSSTTFDERFDSFWNNFSKNIKFEVARHSRYLNWRYNHPVKRYDVWTFSGFFRKGLKGYAITSFQKGGCEAYLIDLCVPPDKDGEKMLSSLENELSLTGVEKVSAWLTANQPLFETFTRCGFEARRDTLGIIPTGRTFVDTLTFDWACRNLSLQMADCDLF